MNADEYIAEAQKALFAFQMLEEALKIRIGLFFEINEILRPRQCDAGKIFNLPLSRLVDLYKEAQGDASLVDNMRCAVPWRNFCAHNAYLHWLYSKTSTSPYSNHSVADLRQVKEFTMDLIERLASEIKSLRCQTSIQLPDFPIPSGGLPVRKMD